MRSMAAAVLLLSNVGLKAQDGSYDVFQPIAKYMALGFLQRCKPHPGQADYEIVLQILHSAFV